MLFISTNIEGTLTNETPAQRTAKALGKLGIAPVKVVSDFLKAVRETTATAMETTYGAKWIEGCKTVFVLTIPAIWDDSARDLMVQAAQNAGYGVHLIDFHLVTEPEAAAAYSLHSRPHNLNRGDSFVICDAGGGTVDLISYRIVDTDPLRIVECARGTGGHIV